MNLSTVQWAQWDTTQSRELLGLFIWVAQYLIGKKVRQIYCGTLMYLCLAAWLSFFVVLCFFTFRYLYGE